MLHCDATEIRSHRLFSRPHLKGRFFKACGAVSEAPHPKTGLLCGGRGTSPTGEIVTVLCKAAGSAVTEIPERQYCRRPLVLHAAINTAK